MNFLQFFDQNFTKSSHEMIPSVISLPSELKSTESESFSVEANKSESNFLKYRHKNGKASSCSQWGQFSMIQKRIKYVLLTDNSQDRKRLKK